MVPGDRVVGEAAQQVDVAGDRGVLEAADPQVAACDAGEHRPGQRRLPLHLPARRHHRQGSGGRDAQRVHRLADDVLAQHRTDRGQAVATSCERRTTRTLEVDVAGVAVAVDPLAEQQRAPVAQTRHEPAELMSGIGLRYRRRRRSERDCRSRSAHRRDCAATRRRGPGRRPAARSARAAVGRQPLRLASGRPSPAVHARSGHPARWRCQVRRSLFPPYGGLGATLLSRRSVS